MKVAAVSAQKVATQRHVPSAALKAVAKDAANAVVATAKVSYSKADTVTAGLGAPWMLTVPRGQQVQTSVELKPGLEAPVTKGAVIGKVVATSNGKPVGEAKAVDVALSAQSFRYYAGWCDKLSGELISTFDTRGEFSYTVPEPIGIVGVIITWNGPVTATGTSEIGRAHV